MENEVRMKVNDMMGLTKGDGKLVPKTGWNIVQCVISTF